MQFRFFVTVQNVLRGEISSENIYAKFWGEEFGLKKELTRIQSNKNFLRQVNPDLRLFPFLAFSYRREFRPNLFLFVFAFFVAWSFWRILKKKQNFARNLFWFYGKITFLRYRKCNFGIQVFYEFPEKFSLKKKEQTLKTKNPRRLFWTGLSSKMEKTPKENDSISDFLNLPLEIFLRVSRFSHPA